MIKRYLFVLSVGGIIFFSGCGATPAKEAATIKIGFIGPITGPAAKYGADNAALLAVQEINGTGGINGKKLEIIMEDGRCEPKTALSAINKLIYADQVKIILGGHCSPETVTIAPIAEQNKVLLLASLSSNPEITHMGDYIFRTTAASTARVPQTTNALKEKFGIKKLALVVEETSFAKPIGDIIQKGFEEAGGAVVAYETILPDEKDFRSILSKVKESNADALYIATQAPDKAIEIISEMRELGMPQKIFGNESVGSVSLIEALKEGANGIVFDAPFYDKSQINVQEFIKKYKEHFGSEPPYGSLTAESYDAVYLVAEALKSVGEDPERVRDYLYGVSEYKGASGTFGFDKSGDVTRKYGLYTIQDGRIEAY